ncbi:PH domain-containing protein [Nocardia barduliensis]|uniref:PH domain-containing protein n=1 Tax=Nocardia barduliensis TaxID=2736643 RepID=UPI0015740BEB|nr:PH domain-containing protein [Nocardia barduliensis]
MSGEPADDTAQAEQPWQRLDKRMLLVHPITEVVKFIPVLIGSVILGTSSGNHGWSVIPIVLIVGFALTRWFTTTYRVGPTHVELRTGLLARKKLSVPRSRIRSVDIEADLLHRMLGLAVLAIGTGQQADSGEQFKLDALAAGVVPPLRSALLAHTAERANEPADRKKPQDSVPGGFAGTRTRAREIGHWSPVWVRYAPLSLTGFAIVAPIVGLALQYGLGEVVFRSDAVHDVEDGGAPVLALAGAALLCAIVLVVSAAACAHYLTTYFGLRVRDDGTTLQLRHGLFTTRQITLDRARLRGATVKEPLLLRLAGAAELEAIMTGENPRQKILPQAPRSAVEHTLGHLLAPDEVSADESPAVPHARPTGAGASDAHTVPGPGSAPLVPHGAAARRRRYTRTLAPVVFVAVVMAYVSLAGEHYSPWWWLVPGLALPIALALAEDRYRGLGHAVLPRTAAGPAWLITRTGSLDRDRDCLEAPGVIGWTVRQTLFQRRAGVATVVAATAAGKKRYAVVDLPADAAWQLVEAVTPGLTGAR